MNKRPSSPFFGHIGTSLLQSCAAKEKQDHSSSQRRLGLGEVALGVVDDKDVDRQTGGRKACFVVATTVKELATAVRSHERACVGYFEWPAHRGHVSTFMRTAEQVTLSSLSLSLCLP